MKKLLMFCLFIFSIGTGSYAQVSKIVTSTGKTAFSAIEENLPTMSIAMAPAAGSYFRTQISTTIPNPSTISYPQSLANGALTTPSINNSVDANYLSAQMARSLRIILPFTPTDFKEIQRPIVDDLAKETLRKTTAKYDILARQFSNEPSITLKRSIFVKDINDRYVKLYQGSLSFIQEMLKELKQQNTHETTISPVKAEVQFGRILETQTALRNFAIEYLLDNYYATEGASRKIVHLDILLSQFRYFYSTVAGNPSAEPTGDPVIYTIVSEKIRFIVEDWARSVRKGRPLLKRSELPFQHHK